MVKPLTEGEKEGRMRAHEMKYPYNLGRYRAYKGRIYRQIWWFIYKCIDKGPYGFLEGIARVNDLASQERSNGR